MVGERVLHYEIIELLGRGAMGSVYKVLDTRLDTFRTLKFLNLGLRDLESAQDHLIREAKTQAQLIHPNIATLLALEIVGDQAFLVIEYIDGCPLDQFLIEENPDLKDRFRLLLPIANALSAAHQQGIIHRDIKPSNILVGRDGSVKVTDFGLAKAIGHTELSKTGETKGSVLYMPPEAFRGERVGKTADVWSLGVVGFEVLEGHPPFEGDSFEAIGYRILREEPPALSERVLDSLPGIGEFLDCCLEKEPADRTQTGQDAYQQLRHVAEGASVEYAAPVIRPVWGRKQVRSRRRQVMRFGASILIALTATFVLFSELSRGLPDHVLSIPILQNEDSPVWNKSGTCIAYLVGEYNNRVLAIREARGEAGAEFHDLPDGSRFTSLNWSLNDTILVLSGSQGAILYNVTTRVWKQIADYWINAAQWSQDGHSLLWACQSKNIDGLEIVSNIGWRDGNEALAPEISTVHIEGLPPPVQELGLYDPIFSHDDSRICFVVYRLATCLGIWSVPREGGEATCVISGEEFNVWDLQWDPVREEILCRQYEEDNGILRLTTDRRTGLVRRVTPVRFPPGEADEITDFHYHPGIDQYVLRAIPINHFLWTSPLSDDGAGFTPLVSAYRQILTPSVSPDQTELLFCCVDVDEGVHIQILNLDTGTHQPLHAPSGDLGSENYPRVDPVNNRYVTFSASPRVGSSVLYYWDRNEGRLRSFDDLSEGGDINHPHWSADGRYIYYRFTPDDETAPRHLLRIEVERTGILQVKGVPDTLYTGRDVYYPMPGPDDEFALYQSGLKDESWLVILEFSTGELRELVKGRNHALSPSREDVYFHAGSGIHRIRNWREGFNRALESELVVEYPPGVSRMGVGHELAVSDDAIFAVLTYTGPGDIKIFRMP